MTLMIVFHGAKKHWQTTSFIILTTTDRAKPTFNF